MTQSFWASAAVLYMGTYQQQRTIWMDGRAHPPVYAPAHVHGVLDRRAEWRQPDDHHDTPRGGLLPSDWHSSRRPLTVVEHWIRHGNVLSQVTIATDPVYLTEPYIRSQEFVLMERGNTNWLYNCEYAMEVPKDKNEVPHHLPGQNPWIGEFSSKHAMPQGGVRGGAETLLPEWRPGATPAPPRRGANEGFRPEHQPAKLAAGEVKAVHVQGKVHMIVGAGANIAVQLGDDGILVADTGAAGTSDKVLAAIKALARTRRSAG
jgi:hypothetical protein